MDVIRDTVSTLFPGLNSILSPRRLVQLPFALNSLSTIPSNPSSRYSVDISQTCPNPSRSCPITTPGPIDTCCINHPSGHFLLAQFWDAKPALGPSDSWTLHGLWPDYCTGGFPANCDRARELSRQSIVSIVEAAAKTTRPRLHQYMNEYWKGLHGDDDLWSHEWNKHGTCVSTLERRCYDDGNSYGKGTSTSTSDSDNDHLDLLDYFTAATTLHSTLKSHDILAAHGIVPSHTETYTLAKIQAALATGHDGHIATVKCTGRHELNEIWMHFVVLGSLRNSTDAGATTSRFVPVAPDGLVSNCPASGIRYLPKDPTDPGAPSHTSHLPRPTGQPFSGRGHLQVHVIDDDDDAGNSHAADEGCLIRQGVWYTSGQCATYRTRTDVVVARDSLSLADDDDDDEARLFTLSSSYAPCAVLEADGRQGKKAEFVCANHLPVQSIFGVGEDGTGHPVLSWKNGTTFYADKRPGRFEKVKVFGDDGDGERKVKLEISWESA